MFRFKASIYKVGINWCVDVPTRISDELEKEKGYIRITGLINQFKFMTNLVPVKNAPYRLFVNGLMMKGGNTALGEIASFSITQNETKIEHDYPFPVLLKKSLAKTGLTPQFSVLSPTRKKDILKYLFYLKTEKTCLTNIEKVITQLKNKEKNIRIP